MDDQGAMERMRMSDGAEIGVYRVAAREARRGGLVLIQEIFGVTAHIRETCDLYARHGYEVIAPALFDREAPGFDAGYDQVERAIEVARQLHPFALSMADTQTCIDALGPAGPVFITGYCYGGSVSFRAAQTCTGLAAASSYYGSMVPQFAAEGPVRCPTICHFGREDAGIPMDGVERAATERPEVTMYVYEAGHGFNSDRRDDYDSASAALALQRTLDLFRANGG